MTTSWAYFGRDGEEYIVDELRSRGLDAHRLPGNNGSDIAIGDALAEVKSAHKTDPNRWQFSFRRHRIRVNDEDIFFLICYNGDDTVLAVFVIPGAAIPDELTKIDITSHPATYRGKWARYRNDWSGVDAIVRNAQRAEAFDPGEIPF